MIKIFSTIQVTKTNLVMATGFSLGIVGAIFNVVKDPFCFILWLVSNFIFIAAAVKDHNRWMVLIFLTYFVTSGIGLFSWKLWN